MLKDFIAELPKRHPEARFELFQPAATDSEAMVRLEALCREYTEAAGCTAELDAERAYVAYIDRFSAIVGTDPAQTRNAFNGVVAGTLVAGSVLDLLLVAAHRADAADLAEAAGHKFDAADLIEAGAHKADGVDVVEAAAHGADFWTALPTFGLSIGLSLCARWWFQTRNGQKAREVSEMVQVSFWNGRLAKALMAPQKMEMAQKALLRLSAAQAKGPQ